MAKLTYNVVIHELSRYEGRQILPKMLFMAVVWVFVDFSRSVTPQIFVHSRIDRFPRTFPLKKTRSFLHLQQKTTTENLRSSQTVR